MIHTVLLALDGSWPAEAALPHAAALAARLVARLLLVGAVSDRTPAGGDTATARRGVVEEGRSSLAQTAARLAADYPALPVDVAAPLGLPADAILGVATRQNAGVIVMADRGGDSPGPWGLGGVAEAVSRRAPVPILLIRRRAVERPVRVGDPGLPWSRRRVRALVPLDGSRSAEAGLKLLGRLRTQLPVTATVLHVLSGAADPADVGSLGSLDALVPATGPDADAGDRPGVRPRPLCWATAAACCHRAAAWLDARGVRAVVQVRAGDVVEEIERAAAESADVVVLGAHAGAPEEWWSLDRVADRLLRCSPCPILLIRCGDTGRPLSAGTPAAATDSRDTESASGGGTERRPRRPPAAS